MLIKNDRSLLGDGVNFQNIRNAEALACLKEQNHKDLDKYRWADHEEITDAERTAGQRMHFSDLLIRIGKLNPNLWVEQSLNYPDSVSLYRYYWKDDGTGKWRRAVEYLSAMEKNWLPEFSHLKVDWQDLPEEPVYGWRQVLIMLLKKKAITWQQVKNEFGDAMGELATRWRIETREFRV